MKRSIIVSSATLAGLAGVMVFHTAPNSLSIGGLPTSAGASTASTTPTTVASPPSTVRSSKKRTTTTTTKGTTPSGSTGTTVASTTTPTTVATTTTTTTVATSGVRTAVGEAVNYYFGVLSVSVTVDGTKITKVSIASLQDGGNYRSQSIDQQSIPMLEQEAMQAQSANIQSISGASYTSAGFAQSLQSALKKLGL
jgi:uncharacterized protein with FMN-binding domain